MSEKNFATSGEAKVFIEELEWVMLEALGNRGSNYLPKYLSFEAMIHSLTLMIDEAVRTISPEEVRPLRSSAVVIDMGLESWRTSLWGPLNMEPEKNMHELENVARIESILKVRAIRILLGEKFGLRGSSGFDESSQVSARALPRLLPHFFDVLLLGAGEEEIKAPG